MIKISAVGGKVTVENDVCRWGLLELPRKPTRVERLEGTTPTTNAAGEGYLCKAVCEFKDGRYPAKIVRLHLTPCDVLAVFSALA